MNKNTLQDWLNIHDLTSPFLSSVLKKHFTRISPFVEKFDETEDYAIVSYQKALSWIRSSLIEYFGSLDANVGQVFDRINVRSQSDDMEYPCVIFEGVGYAPVVYCNYDGTPDDVLNLAHEYGHALQFELAGKAFIPPIWRETAAFICEFLVVEYIQKSNKNYSQILKTIMLKHDDVLFGDELKTLKKALETDKHPYYYRANYPVARIIAKQIIEKRNKGNAYALMKGNKPNTLRE